MTKDANNTKDPVEVVWMHEEGKFLASVDLDCYGGQDDDLPELEGWGETRAQAAVQLEIEVRRVIGARR